MDQLIECVPNFSEGNDLEVIRRITDRVESVEGVKLLGVDPGQATNRTVVTFVGPPEQVVEAAFRAVKMASELIDMRQHTGEHPRFGATDVCPLVPVSGIRMEETVQHAHRLARRIGEEIGIPVYCYESAALKPDRKNLAVVRSGEYEGLKEKLGDPAWKPDFGPGEFIPRTGAIAVGARDFLVAYNINLNTTSTRRANAIAFDVRERGRVKREGHPLTGKIVKDADGNPVMIPGSLREVKAIGWFIEEYGVAQISMNLTNISITPIHVAFDEVCRKAEARGIRVTGSELVGLVPLHAMLEAGRYFLRKQQRSTGVPDKELIKIAVKSMGLDELGAFDPDEKIIEYQLQKGEGRLLADMSLKTFLEETASESPAPGGGSVSAYMGALGAALGTMVANLSSHKRGWDDRWEEFSGWAERGKAIQMKLLLLVDEDTRAFKGILAAYGLPKKTDQDKKVRQEAIESATLRAIEIPFEVMREAYDGFEVARSMVETGNPASVSDAGVGAIALCGCMDGAWLNVRINAPGLADHPVVQNILREGEKLVQQGRVARDQIVELVHKRMSE
jgi:glutamate formiminotransferase / formiminotetrahydrofolate cyclodeaminase